MPDFPASLSVTMLCSFLRHFRNGTIPGFGVFWCRVLGFFFLVAACVCVCVFEKGHSKL